MRILLGLLAVATGVYGLVLLGGATTVMHQIVSYLLFVISTIALSGVGIIEAIGRIEVR